MADLVEALNLITSSRIGELYSSRETEVRGLSMPCKARVSALPQVQGGCQKQKLDLLVRCSHAPVWQPLSLIVPRDL
jgi:hypothetical protein